MVNSIKLRKGARIGQPAAEADEDFLRPCFLNIGSYDNLVDSDSKQCILLGRTGSGKSALISEVRRRFSENSISILPEGLALNNIANSAIINYFEESGVHLDGFYVLLWKHILAVELIKKRYRISDENGQRRFFDSINDICRRDKTKIQAVEYLQSWGEKFWLETEYRTSDLTRKVESKLEGSMGVSQGPIHLGAKGAQSLNEEERVEVVRHGQRAVDEIQIRSLAKVIDLLADDIFPPTGPQYFVCIDGLDEDWAQDAIRFKLLKALFETIKSFQQVRSVKIIITMRTDLLYSLFNSIVSPGFQSEKFSGYYLQLRWTRAELAELLNRRVQHLFEFQYSGHNVGLQDILPIHMKAKVRAVDYILDRTFFRPREAIAFFNRCIEKAEGSTSITPEIIKEAEYLYSGDRLVALCDEWRREYPNLKAMSDILRRASDGVEVSHYRDKELEAFCLKLPRGPREEDVRLGQLADEAAMDAHQGGLPFLQLLFSILYRTGLVGLKLAATDKRIFSFHEGLGVEPDQIELSTKVYVHKAFWVTLGIKTSEFDARSL